MDINSLNRIDNLHNEELYNTSKTNTTDKNILNKEIEKIAGEYNSAIYTDNTKTEVDSMAIQDQLSVHNTELNNMEKGQLYASDVKVGQTTATDYTLENSVNMGITSAVTDNNTIPTNATGTPVPDGVSYGGSVSNAISGVETKAGV